MFYLAERSAGSNADSDPADFAKNVSTKLWAPTSGIFFPWAQAWSQTSVNPRRGRPETGQRRSPLLSAAACTCAAAPFTQISDAIRSGRCYSSRETAPLMSRFRTAPISQKYHEKQRLQSANDRAEIAPRATEALLHFCR